MQEDSTTHLKDSLLEVGTPCASNGARSLQRKNNLVWTCFFSACTDAYIEGGAVADKHSSNQILGSCPSHRRASNSQERCLRSEIDLWHCGSLHSAPTWDAMALNAFKGRFVAHVGELYEGVRRKSSRTNTSPAFCTALRDGWELERRVQLHNWAPQMVSELTVWRRKGS